MNKFKCDNCGAEDNGMTLCIVCMSENESKERKQTLKEVLDLISEIKKKPDYGWCTTDKDGPIYDIEYLEKEIKKLGDV